MIYLDNAATTRVYDECADIINYYNSTMYYNPSALYKCALDAASDISLARDKIAAYLGCEGSEVIFTASGSEADNIALRCSLRRKTGKILISSVEHSAIYNTAKYLESRGYILELLPTDRHGRVKIEDLEEKVTPDTVMVSVMHISNDTGALNDIARISKIVKSQAPNAIMHSDGVQAFGKIDIDVKALGVDLYSISGHKIHAPKGVGALYVNKKVHLSPFIFGGGQESGIRSATENVAGICAFAKAAEIKYSRMQKTIENMRNHRDTLALELEKNIDGIIINTDLSNSAPHILSVAIADLRGEVALHCLEDKGIIVGIGSACTAKKSDKRIASSLGLDSKYSGGVLRISLSEFTTAEEIKTAASEIVKIAAEQRQFIKR